MSVNPTKPKWTDLYIPRSPRNIGRVLTSTESPISILYLITYYEYEISDVTFVSISISLTRILQLRTNLIVYDGNCTLDNNYVVIMYIII